MSSFLKEDLAVGSAGGKSRYPGKFLRVGRSRGGGGEGGGTAVKEVEWRETTFLFLLAG